jgi:RND family efflux transporter MFP subunit
LSSARRLWSGFVVLLAMLPFTGCGAAGQDASSERAAGAPIPAVEVVQARRGALPLFHRLTGTVRAAGEVAIYPQTTGSIVEVLAQNGDSVQKGAPLVRIQAVGSRAQLAQARSSVDVARAAHAEAVANLRQLEAQYERNAALGREGLVPEDTVVTLRTQVEAARAAEARARAQARVAEATVDERADVQQQTVVRAPISGRIGQRNAEVGMRVDEQTALFLMGRLENVRVEVPVTQEILARVREGQRVEIAMPGFPIVATVSRISPFLEAASYSAEVEIDVPNQDGRLVSGMFVTADIFYGESEQATLVPTSALYDHPTSGERGVFVASTAPLAAGPASGNAGRDAKAAADRQPRVIAMPFKPVTLVAEGPATVGVRGLQPGEWVVVVGQHLLAAQVGEAPPQGRARAIAWDRILELQRLQRDDLLREFMEKQQRLANPSTIRSDS